MNQNMETPMTSPATEGPEETMAEPLSVPHGDMLSSRLLALEDRIVTIEMVNVPSHNRRLRTLERSTDQLASELDHLDRKVGAVSVEFRVADKELEVWARGVTTQLHNKIQADISTAVETAPKETVKVVQEPCATANDDSFEILERIAALEAKMPSSPTEVSADVTDRIATLEDKVVKLIKARKVDKKQREEDMASLKEQKQPKSDSKEVIEALQTGQKDIESSLAKLNTTCLRLEEDMDSLNDDVQDDVDKLNDTSKHNAKILAAGMRQVQSALQATQAIQTSALEAVEMIKAQMMVHLKEMEALKKAFTAATLIQVPTGVDINKANDTLTEQQDTLQKDADNAEKMDDSMGKSAAAVDAIAEQDNDDLSAAFASAMARAQANHANIDIVLESKR